MRMAAAVACALATGAAFPASAPSRSDGPTVRLRWFRFVDRSRTLRLPDGTRVPRPLETVVRYPATGGPYPLIVFGHGYALTPGTYSRLLQAWARAGYVVAVFGKARFRATPTQHQESRAHSASAAQR